MDLKYLYIFFIFSSGIFGFSEDTAPAPVLSAEQRKAGKLLTFAVKTNNIKSIKKALDLGADINLDIEGGTTTPIYWALASTQNKEIAKFLIRHGAMESLSPYVSNLIFRYCKKAPIKQELKFAKEVIDETIKEESNLNLEESAQAKKDISLAADLPIDVANIMASYTYSMSQDDLENLKYLSELLEDFLEGVFEGC